MSEARSRWRPSKPGDEADDRGFVSRLVEVRVLRVFVNDLKALFSSSVPMVSAPTPSVF